MSRITVLYYPDEITRYSLAPLILSRHARAFHYTRNLDEVLSRPRNPNLLLLRFARIATSDQRGVLKQLRDRYERIIYFDALASVDRLRTSALEIADLYYKKQIARDRDSYLRPLLGSRRFRTYYQREYGIEEELKTRPPVPPEHLGKLRLAWNFGIGIYPREKLRLRTARVLERRLSPRSMRLLLRPPRRPRRERQAFVSARFARAFESEALSCQRRLFEEAIGDDPRFRTGRVDRHTYNRELRDARVTLSPFGHGEVCFRDFEAVASGSTLVKPAMEYVETWPDIYQHGETCAYAQWDGSDVVETCGALLEDETRARRLAENAFDAMHDAYGQIDRKVEQLLADFRV